MSGRIFPNRENPQVIANDVYFQQDGAPAHYHRLTHHTDTTAFDSSIRSPCILWGPFSVTLGIV
ncbi:hypothetical protein NQ315_015936 [Exocentrus adspersus]|uniref:Uncharacterized protein n=1 Tax=Exocentrus adspersus TaxID=1586481 RepID=A0AAV8VC71_9CUCU|nr:hypothetical protein NQ315_015936 [Exocentrus adspersus]